MKLTIDNVSQFRDQFHHMGRGTHFSYDGLSALFDLLELSGDDYELDVIALCCEYIESSIEDVLKEYDLESLEELEGKTLVMKVDDETIIYQQF